MSEVIALRNQLDYIYVINILWQNRSHESVKYLREAPARPRRRRAGCPGVPRPGLAAPSPGAQPGSPAPSGSIRIQLSSGAACGSLSVPVVGPREDVAGRAALTCPHPAGSEVILTLRVIFNSSHNSLALRNLSVLLR